MLPKKIKKEIKLFVKYKKLLKLQKLKHFSFTIRLEAPICSRLSKRPKARTENSVSLGVALQVSPVAIHFLFFSLLCIP